jgi:hypothetical protein
MARAIWHMSLDMHIFQNCNDWHNRFWQKAFIHLLPSAFFRLWQTNGSFAIFLYLRSLFASLRKILRAQTINLFSKTAVNRSSSWVCLRRNKILPKMKNNEKILTAAVRKYQVKQQ